MSRFLRIAFAMVATAPLIAQQYHVYQYGQRDGLPHSEVYAVEQTGDGRIWAATGTGIASFDGGKWQRHHDTLGGLWQALVADGERHFWALTTHAPVRVVHSDGTEWRMTTPAALPTEARPSRLAVADDKTLIVGTFHHGITIHRDGTWQRLRIAGKDDYAVYNIACRGHDLMLGGADGLWRFDLQHPEREGVRIQQVKPQPVLGVAFDDNTLWVAQRMWLGQIEMSDMSVQTVHESDRIGPYDVAVTIEPNGRGAAYLGNYLGIYRINADGSLSTYGRAQGLADDTATDFKVDHEGNLWVAAPRGLSKVADDSIVAYTSTHGLYSDEVSAISKRGDDGYVLGHEGGLTLIENGQYRTIAFKGKPTEARVLDLEPGADGRMWLAASWQGVGDMSADGQITWHANGSQIQAVARLPVGLIVGSSTGTWRLDAGRWHRLPSDPPTLRNPVRRLRVDEHGGLWGFTSKVGAWRLDPDGSIEHWQGTEAPERDVYSCIEWQGRRFVGSQAGLLEISGDRIAPAVDPGIDIPVYAFAADVPSRTLWIGTSNGVAVWSDDVLRWRTTANGLVGHEVSRDALHIDDYGIVRVGTNGGLNEIDARRPAMAMARPKPRLEITGVDSNTVGVIYRFRVDSYLNERHVQFRYKLAGLTDEWLGPVELPERELQFASLPEGEFRLHLVATTPDGRTSREAISSTFTVPTPLYRQTWFVGVGILVLATMAFGLFTSVTQRRYARRLELEVLDRTRELATSEHAARQEREQLLTTVQSIADGVAAADKDGRVFLWNRAAEEMTGIARETAIGRDIRELLGLPESYRTEPSIRLRLDESSDEDEYEAVVAPFGEGEQIVVAFRDIRQRLADERDLAHRQRLESLGLLAGGIAHDFNNYLTVILGTITLMECEGPLSEEQQDHVATASTTVTRAQELTQQLLTFSTGGAPVRTVVDMTRLVHDSVAIAMSGSQIAANVTAADDLPPAKVDKGQISQVLHNLLLNARQAMADSGNISIDIRTLAESRPGCHAGEWLVVEVADDGPGMARDVRQRIFDPFYSSRGSTGLGLAVTHSIVTRHGGTISVRSQPGSGTTFEFLLPVSDEPLPAERPSDTDLDVGKLRVLIMDDETYLRRTLEKLLERVGHSVVGVADGRAAITAFEQAITDGEPFDLALFDLTIAGGMGGVEAAKEVRKNHPTARLVAVSGYSTDPVLSQFAEHGFSEAMCKPFTLTTLKQTLARAMRG